MKLLLRYCAIVALICPYMLQNIHSLCSVRPPPAWKNVCSHQQLSLPQKTVMSSSGPVYSCQYHALPVISSCMCGWSFLDTFYCAVYEGGKELGALGDQNYLPDQPHLQPVEQEGLQGGDAAKALREAALGQPVDTRAIRVENASVEETFLRKILISLFQLSI